MEPGGGKRAGRRGGRGLTMAERVAGRRDFGSRCLTTAGPFAGRRGRVFRCLTMALVAGVLLSSQACVGGPPGAGEASSPRPRGRGPLRREDRVVIPEFTRITAVAVSQRLVFAAVDGALGIYDRQFAAWLPPFTEADGFPRGRVRLMAADPATDAVWIATPGNVLIYRPLIDQLTSVIIPGTVDMFMFDRRDYGGGAYVRASGQWSKVTATGFVSPIGMSGEQLPSPADRIIPSTLEQVYNEYPALRSFEMLLTRDDQLRSWPVSAGAKAPDRTEVWLGTYGNGLFQVDPLFAQAEPRAFGLLGDDPGALAPAADGVWIATGSARDPRSGLTFASHDLQEWRWIEPTIGGVLRGARTNDLVVLGRSAWLATDRGLARIDIRNPADVRFWSATTGLPSDEVLAVSPRDSGSWAGTARGLVFVADSVGDRRGTATLRGETIASGTAVRALLSTGDTLWIGSDAGLLLLAPGSTTPVRAAAAASEPRLLRPIQAIAYSDSVVAIADAGEVFRINLRSGRLLPRLTAVDFRIVGGITTLAIDTQTIWVGGANGTLIVSRATNASIFLPAVAGRRTHVRDILLSREFAWVATEAGVVRLTRTPDGMVR